MKKKLLGSIIALDLWIAIVISNVFILLYIMNNNINYNALLMVLSSFFLLNLIIFGVVLYKFKNQIKN